MRGSIFHRHYGYRPGVGPGRGGGPAAIYGVAWDKSTSPALTRTDDAVGLVAAAGVDAGTVANDFDDAEIFGEITTVTDSAGNVFVRIPRVYIEQTDGPGFHTWRVSRWPFGEAYLPACFWDFATSQPLDYVDIGAYPASLSGDNKLESKAGTYPLVNKNIVDMRGYAQANGAGYQLLDIHAVDLLQALLYIEFATLDLQSVMAGYTSGQYSAAHVATASENGANRIIVAAAHAALYEVGQAISVGTTQGGNQIFYGRTITGKTVIDASNTAVEFDGDPVNITAGNILYNTGWRNGFSGGIAASSGSLVSNSNGKYPMMYRGIENIWGNVGQFIDGVNVNDWQAWVCRDADEYASNFFAAPYEQLGYVNHSANGYVVALGWDAARPFARFPVAVDDVHANAGYRDYYTQSTGRRIVMLGGYWGNGASAGPAFWYLLYASSSANVFAGARLVRKGVSA